MTVSNKLDDRTKDNNENGSIALLTALLMLIMISFLGLAVDFGYAYLQRTRLQSVADAEALACVTNPSSAPCPLSGGDRYPIVNLYGFTIAIDNPGDDSLCPLPLTQDNCATATATVQWNTFFINLFGVNNLKLSASATAGMVGQNDCMETLGTSGAGIDQSGSGTISTVNCGISVNQTGVSINQTGSGNIISSSIKVRGSVRKVGSGTISKTTSISSPVVDQFSSVPAPVFTPPPPGTCAQINLVKYSGTATAPSGNYCGGVSITGSGTVTLNPGYFKGISSSGSGTLKFNPGDYVIYGSGMDVSGSGPVTLGAGTYVVYGGGANFSGSGNVSGTSVLIYNSGNATYPPGALNATGSGGFNLSAPMTGPDAGMLFFQSANNTNDMNIKGSGNSTLNGNIYAPSAGVNLTGSSGTTLPIGKIVVKNINLSGSGNISVTNAFTPSGGSNSTRPVLVN